VAAEICRPPATGTGPVTFSATSGTSARYQYRKKVPRDSDRSGIHSFLLLRHSFKLGEIRKTFAR
jgi:hypothetical protein